MSEQLGTWMDLLYPRFEYLAKQQGCTIAISDDGFHVMETGKILKFESIENLFFSDKFSVMDSMLEGCCEESDVENES